MIKFDFATYTKKYLNEQDYSTRILNIKNQFLNNGQMKGWYDLNTNQIDEIIKTAEYVKANADIFIVIGIGGSYLGAKAIIEAESSYFNKKSPEILFAGYNLSSNYLAELLEYIKGKRIVINIISKSGGTIEPNIAFSKIKEYMETIYSEVEMQERVIVTTDSSVGKLVTLANQKKYKKFVIPSNIGGRFSVFTPVGLLPIAVASIDIKELIAGATAAKENIDDAYKYAVIRDKLYNSGRYVESFIVYEEKLAYFAEWLKQLYGETQGKNNKAILPTSMLNTRDLHSLGQYMQEGKEIIFETNIYIKNKEKLFVDEYHKNLSEIEDEALNSVCLAHYNGHTPSIIIELDELNAFNLGYLMFFNFIASMAGAYLLGVNYFDQPGVNGYKEILIERLK